MPQIRRLSVVTAMIKNQTFAKSLYCLESLG